MTALVKRYWRPTAKGSYWLIVIAACAWIAVQHTQVDRALKATIGTVMTTE